MSIFSEVRTFPRPVWILFAGTLVNRFGNFVLIFLVLFMKERGFSTTTAGLALSAYGAGGIAASLIGGYLADRAGRRNTIVLSMVVSGVVMLAMSQATSLSALIILTGLAGLFAEMYRPPAAALLADLIGPEQRVTGFAVYRLAINLGMAIGPAVGGLLADRSFFYVFLGDALTSFVYAIIALVALPNTSAAHHKTEDRRSAARVILHDRDFVVFLAAALVIGIVFMQSFCTYPLQIEAFGHATSVYGLLLSINGFIVMAIELPLSAVTRRHSAPRVMAVGMALIGLGFGLTALVSSLPLLIVTVFIWTMGEITVMPVAGAFVANIAPAHLRGRYQGVWSLTFGVAMVLAPIIGTAVFERSQVAVWGMCVILGVASALLTAFGVRRK